MTQELIERLDQLLAGFAGENDLKVGPHMLAQGVEEARSALQSQSARIAELREGLRIIAKWRDGSPQPDTLSWKRIAKAMQATAHEALTKDSTSGGGDAE